ncbi:MAG: Fic family protein [bacterium]
MTRYNAHDNFFYPGTNIPQNKLNIKDTELLEEIEKESMDRVYKLFLTEFPKQYTAKYLDNIHEEIFGKIYTWAGKYRNVDLEKGNTRFANCQYIPKLMREWENFLREIQSHNHNKHELAYKLSVISVEFNAIHPYRDGNGRTIRFLLDQLAVQHEYQTIWSNINFSEEFRKEYMSASEKGVIEKDYKPMTNIIERNLIK